MSLYDLFHELPCWLDDEIKQTKNLIEITDPAVIGSLDHSSLRSYHLNICEKGIVAAASGNAHSIWTYRAASGKVYALGKYLEFTCPGGSLKFWLGLVVYDNRMDMYLWFGKKPPPETVKYLGTNLIEIIEKYGYWYKINNENEKPLSDIFDINCGIESSPLDNEHLKELENNVKKSIRRLLDAVQQAGQTAIF